MSNSAVFLSSVTVETDPAGALGGDGSIGDPLEVLVDGVTITVNGSNQLVAEGGEGITGSLTAGQVPYATGASTVASSADVSFTAGLLSGITFSGNIPIGTAPIVVTGGNDGFGDAAVIFDSADNYIALVFNQEVDAHLLDDLALYTDGGGGLSLKLSGSVGALLSTAPVVSGNSLNVNLTTGSADSGNSGVILIQTGNASGTRGGVSVDVGAGGFSVIGSSQFSGQVTLSEDLNFQGTTQAIRTGQSNGNNFVLQAYDLDLGDFGDFVTFTAGNTPTMVVAPPGTGGTVTLHGSTIISDGSATATDFIIGSTSIVPLTGTTSSIGGSLLVGVGSTATGTATVAGAVVGQPVAVSASDGTAPNALISLSAAVTSANTVTVQLTALAAVTPTAKTYNVAVLL